MNTHPGSAPTATRGAPSYLGGLTFGGRRTWLVFAAVMLAGGAALNWSWLVAAGIAPLLLAIAPCAAMCALGLCFKSGGDGCKRQGTTANLGQSPVSGDIDGLGRT